MSRTLEPKELKQYIQREMEGKYKISIAETAALFHEGSVSRNRSLHALLLLASSNPIAKRVLDTCSRSASALIIRLNRPDASNILKSITNMCIRGAALARPSPLVKPVSITTLVDLMLDCRKSSQTIGFCQDAFKPEPDTRTVPVTATATASVVETEPNPNTRSAPILQPPIRTGEQHLAKLKKTYWLPQSSISPLKQMHGRHQYKLLTESLKSHGKRYQLQQRISQNPLFFLALCNRLSLIPASETHTYATDSAFIQLINQVSEIADFSSPSLISPITEDLNTPLERIVTMHSLDRSAVKSNIASITNVNQRQLTLYVYCCLAQPQYTRCLSDISINPHNLVKLIAKPNGLRFFQLLLPSLLNQQARTVFKQHYHPACWLKYLYACHRYIPTDHYSRLSDFSTLLCNPESSQRIIERTQKDRYFIKATMAWLGSAYYQSKSPADQFSLINTYRNTKQADTLFRNPKRTQIIKLISYCRIEYNLLLEQPWINSRCPKNFHKRLDHFEHLLNTETGFFNHISFNLAINPVYLAKLCHFLYSDGFGTPTAQEITSAIEHQTVTTGLLTVSDSYFDFIVSSLAKTVHIDSKTLKTWLTTATTREPEVIKLMTFYLERVLCDPRRAGALQKVGFVQAHWLVLLRTKNSVKQALLWTKLLLNSNSQRFLAKNKPTNGWIQWFKSQQCSEPDIHAAIEIFSAPQCRLLIHSHLKYLPDYLQGLIQNIAIWRKNRSAPNYAIKFLQTIHHRLTRDLTNLYGFNPSTIARYLPYHINDKLVWIRLSQLVRLNGQSVIPATSSTPRFSTLRMLTQEGLGLAHGHLLQILSTQSRYNWLQQVLTSTVQTDSQDYLAKHPTIHNWITRIARTPKFVAGIAAQTHADGLNDPRKQPEMVQKFLADWKQCTRSTPAPLSSSSSSTQPNQLARVPWDRTRQLFPLCQVSQQIPEDDTASAADDEPVKKRTGAIGSRTNS